ncbi:hypothetical protein [Leucobacter sp. M11]|uniref:hypothetical protein n=1 Tax=Leucobacter sp. M11 TaxID=2993565 RepID=UPI002D7EF78D|nr:hypothetical protein [Leucobacter sp. M11]MEB4614575.1 hypothetical protein [Leucobacter sp. M11]
MTSLWTRTSTIIALTAAAALGLTACSGGTAPVGSSTEEQAPASQEPLTIDTFADRMSKAQTEAGSVHTEMSTEFQGQSQVMTGDMTITEKPSDMKMSVTMELPGGMTMEMRMLDAKLFMNMGEMSQNKFVETPLSGPEAEQFLGQLDQLNPQQQQQALADAVTDFSAAEKTEKIDGVETRAYTLTLDTKEMLKGQADVLAAAGSDMPETLEYVMHVGSDDLPRRVVMTVAGVVVETNFSAWGKPVSIEAPAADQLIDEKALGM